jgi:hypothetical protein
VTIKGEESTPTGRPVADDDHPFISPPAIGRRIGDFSVANAVYRRSEIAAIGISPVFSSVVFIVTVAINPKITPTKRILTIRRRQGKIESIDPTTVGVRLG